MAIVVEEGEEGAGVEREEIREEVVEEEDVEVTAGAVRLRKEEGGEMRVVVAVGVREEGETEDIEMVGEV